MARPESKTVAYFPFVVKDGDTLFLLENKYGCEGLGFFTGVMRFLSQTADHHYCIKDEVKKMRFFATIKIDEAKGIDMLNIMSITGKINKVLWDGNRVIVSEDFLGSINDAYKKRVNDIITMKEIVTFYELMYPVIQLPEPETTPNSKKTDRNTHIRLDKTKLNNNRDIVTSDEATIYQSINKAFLSKNGDKFTNYKKEGSAIKQIIKKSKDRQPENTELFAKDMIARFWELKTSKDKFWQGQPFLPSSLNATGIWDRVLETFRESSYEMTEEEFNLLADQAVQ